MSLFTETKVFATNEQVPGAQQTVISPPLNPYAGIDAPKQPVADPTTVGRHEPSAVPAFSTQPDGDFSDRALTERALDTHAANKSHAMGPYGEAVEGEEAQQVWALENKKGKPVSLIVGAKLRQFEVDLKPGSYLLFAFTTHGIPGGDKGPRYVAVDVNVRLTEGETILHEVYKLHSAEKTMAAEWVVREGQTATCFMQYRLNSPVGPFKVMAKLFRRDHPAVAGDDFDDKDFVYQHISVESIQQELSRETVQKQRSCENGMIRPFLLLASMHPAARQQIADLLSIPIYGPDFQDDAHLQAWALITKNRKGMQAKCMHSYESLKPANWKEGAGADWWQCLYRVTTEVHKGEMSMKEEIQNTQNDLFLAACSDSSDPRLDEMELRLLHAIAETFFKAANDKEGFVQRLEELERSEEVLDLKQRLRTNGIVDEDILRFTVGYALELLEERKEKEQKRQDLRDNEAEKEEELLSDSQDDRHSEFLGDRTYTAAPISPQEFIKSIKENLLLGRYDPRSVGQRGLGIAKKVAVFVGKKGTKRILEHYVIPTIVLPVFPPLLIPWFLGNLLHKFTGSNHETLYLAVVQLLLQRLLLAAHGIRIREFY